jgi:hypothetical protein
MSRTYTRRAEGLANEVEAARTAVLKAADASPTLQRMREA